MFLPPFLPCHSLGGDGGCLHAVPLPPEDGGPRSGRRGTHGEIPDGEACRPPSRCHPREQNPPTSLSPAGDAAQRAGTGSSDRALVSSFNSNFLLPFYPKESRTPAAALLLLLLLTAGDIETNPGPFYCPTCHNPINYQHTSIQCNTCNRWSHLTCTTLSTPQQYTNTWTCCQNHPDPSPPPANNHTLNILQLNTNSIKKKHTEINHFLHKHNIHIALIQETKLAPQTHLPSFPSFTTLRQDKTQQQGGLITLIHKNIQFTNKTTDLKHRINDNTLEIQGIQIQIKNSTYNLTNIYIPPHTSTPRGYTPQLHNLANIDKHIIGGDFNAHHPIWLASQQEDARGRAIIDQLHQMNILNTRSHPTRQPLQRNQVPTSPDITLCSPSLHLNTTWKTIQDLSSDHLPIIITVHLTHPTNPPPSKTFINYKKADWTSYTHQIEDLSDFDLASFSSIDEASKHLTRSIHKASVKHIPQGKRKQYNPNFSPQIGTLIAQRNNLRQKRDPTDQEVEQLQFLNNTITDLIAEKQTEGWQRKLDTMNHKTNSTQLWKTIKTINNSHNNPPPTHEALLTPQNKVPSPKEHCNILNNHYSKISLKPTVHSNRQITKQIHKLKVDTSADPPFTPQTITQAIKTLKNSRAEGPDKISNYHLKHLGQNAISAITAIFNFSWLQNKIPSNWKISHIIPILKPKKPPNLPSSYRPISLLSTLSKLLEKLIHNRIKHTIPHSPDQHGFRQQHSTSTLLTNATQLILNGFNQSSPPARTVLVAVDIEKAFDTVPRHILSQKILNTDLHTNDKKWLTNFLADRQCRVTHKQQMSKTKKLHNGVPQGSILSPTLFNLFMHDLPRPDPAQKITTFSYADDLTILGQHPDYKIAARNTQKYLTSLEQWLRQNRMTISPQKSSVTLLTPSTHESSKHPPVYLNGHRIPLNKTPTILGLTYDTHMTFTPHTNNITLKTNRKLNALKTLSNTKFGQQKESLSVLYKQFMRTTLNYASTAWFPTIKNTNIEKLQIAQNNALRTITGCTKTTPIPHLHAETKILPIKDHMNMIGTQFYTKALETSHPTHHITQPQPPDRNKKSTPSLYYSQQYHNIPPAPENTIQTKHIHTHFTRQALQNRPHNSILNIAPPDISKEEESLPRNMRVTLARLRSGHHPSLNFYKHKINLSPSPTCPRCHHHTEDTEHLLLYCPAHTQPRQRHNITSIRDLWARPRAVACFLEEAGFS